MYVVPPVGSTQHNLRQSRVVVVVVVVIESSSRRRRGETQRHENHTSIDASVAMRSASEDAARALDSRAACARRSANTDVDAAFAARRREAEDEDDAPMMCVGASGIGAMRRARVVRASVSAERGGYATGQNSKQDKRIYKEYCSYGVLCVVVFTRRVVHRRRCHRWRRPSRGSRPSPRPSRGSRPSPRPRPRPRPRPHSRRRNDKSNLGHTRRR